MNMAWKLLQETQTSVRFQIRPPCHHFADISDRRSSTLVEEKGWKCREMEEKRPIYRWPGWECFGRSTRTLLPCPVGLRPLTVTGLITAKNWNLDHSSTTEAGERAREADNKCVLRAYAYITLLNVTLLIKKQKLITEIRQKTQCNKRWHESFH